MRACVRACAFPCGVRVRMGVRVCVCVCIHICTLRYGRHPVSQDNLLHHKCWSSAQLLL